MSETESTTPGATPEGLRGGETRVLRETISGAGRRVCLALSRSRYQGARPYYTVSYAKPSGEPLASRYTPIRARADWLFDRFAADVTGPAALADPAALLAPDYAACLKAWADADVLLAEMTGRKPA